MRRRLFLIVLLLVALPQVGRAQGEASTAYAKLEKAWAETQKSDEALTIRATRDWIDRFWQFRQHYSGTEEAQKATTQAFELTWQLRDLDGLEEKYRAVSIHNEAMSQIVRYVPSVVGPENAVGERRSIAEQSESSTVQAAALFELADHYYNQKRYARVASLLDSLRTEYGVTAEHDRYGTAITQMRESVKTLSVGSRLPRFHTVDIEGNVITSSELEGNVVLLYFYGAGCGSCIMMYPTLNALYDRYSNDDFYLLGISADRSYLTLEVFHSFLQEYEIDWPQTLERALFDQYKVGVLSTAFLLDKEGRLVWISRSDEVLETIDTLQDKELAEAVEVLLKQ